MKKSLLTLHVYMQQVKKIAIHALEKAINDIEGKKPEVQNDDRRGKKRECQTKKAMRGRR
jgi:hypothetical protein